MDEEIELQTVDGRLVRVGAHRALSRLAEHFMGATYDPVIKMVVTSSNTFIVRMERDLTRERVERIPPARGKAF
jgi:hypothetical protein